MDHLVDPVLVVGKHHGPDPLDTPPLLAASEFQLEAPVRHFRGIDLIRFGTGGGRQVDGREQVPPLLVVQVDFSEELSSEQVIIDTEVEGSRLFPTEAGIAEAADGCGVVADQDILGSIVRNDRLDGGGAVHVTVEAVGQAQGQQVDPAGLPCEILPGDVPLGTDAPERGVPVQRILRDQVRRIRPRGRGKRVLSVKGIGRIGISREETLLGIGITVGIGRESGITARIGLIGEGRSQEPAHGKGLIVVAVGNRISHRLVHTAGDFGTCDEGQLVKAAEGTVEIELVAPVVGIGVAPVLGQHAAGRKVRRNGSVRRLVGSGGNVDGGTDLVGCLVIDIPGIGIQQFVLEPGLEMDPLREFEIQPSLDAGIQRPGRVVTSAHLLHGVIPPVLIREGFVIEMTLQVRRIEEPLAGRIQVGTHDIGVISVLIEKKLEGRAREIHPVVFPHIVIECAVQIEIQPLV